MSSVIECGWSCNQLSHFSLKYYFVILLFKLEQNPQRKEQTEPCSCNKNLYYIYIYIKLSNEAQMKCESGIQLPCLSSSKITGKQIINIYMWKNNELFVSAAWSRRVAVYWMLRIATKCQTGAAQIVNVYHTYCDGAWSYCLLKWHSNKRCVVRCLIVPYIASIIHSFTICMPICFWFFF